MYSANAGSNGQVIIAGTNAMATAMLSLLPPDGTPTLVALVPTSPSDGMQDRC
jgi:hypothetical protein